jgi:ssDNA-binding replication factor A large subunit
MIEGNFGKYIERLAKASGLPRDEIERKIEAKKAKLVGLISNEGAAQLVASELKVNLDNEKLKINELIPGMRKVNTVGKIINLFPVRAFKSKKGEDSKVVNLILADDTSNIKVVLWDTNHISLIETGQIAQGSIVEITNGSMRNNEVHLGSFSEFKSSSEKVDNVITAKMVTKKVIKELATGENVKVRAFVVQSFEPRFFNVCSECKKKVIPDGPSFMCEEHGNVMPSKRALINVVIDDGTETIRAVMFHDNVLKIGIKDFDNPELVAQQRNNILGKEFLLSGNVRPNNYFNFNEFIVDNIEEVNLDEVIKELEGN